MFEKISQIAEHAATNVSRRQFFGSLGRAAMVLAAAAGGLLAMPGAADARPDHICSGFSGICAGLSAGSGCVDRDGPGRCRRIRATNNCFCDQRGR